MRCEEPVKIIEILRLWEHGFSQRDIANSVKCGKTTVGEIQKRARDKALTYEKAAAMTNDEIKALLYPDSFGRKYQKDEPDWEAIHKRLCTHKRLNLQYIWEEYRSENPDGLGYSQFCKRYGLWQEQTGKHVVMPRERDPGKELFVDWMGDTLPCVTDSLTGEVMRAHFFVATLGDSNYPYVEAFPDERLDKWLLAHVHTLKHIGGVPRVIVPDNLKAGVQKPQYYDPKLNPSYWDFAKHYDVAVIPARVRRPQDKGAVEGCVGWLETWLLEWLRGKQYFSFEALNADIRQRLAELSDRPYQKRAGSRSSIFEAVDQPALRPLPATHYDYAEYAVRRVPDSYHVEWEGFYYSVPHTLHRQKVTLRVTAEIVEIINENRERVAMHPRRSLGSRYVTNMAHMPEKHRIMAQLNRFDGQRYRTWAKTIGDNTFFVIDTLLKAQHVEETAYRSCMGILQCAKRYGDSRLEAACRKAKAMHACSYTTVTNILKHGLDTAPVENGAKPTPNHENLRGAAAYQ